MQFLISGACIIVALIILITVGSSSPATGFFFGIAIASLEAAGFSAFFDRMPRPAQMAALLRIYMLGAFIRIPLLLGLFFSVAVFLKVNGFGLLAGTGIGMVGASVLSFRKMNRVAENLQQAGKEK